MRRILALNDRPEAVSYLLVLGILLFIFGWFSHSLLKADREATVTPVREDSSTYKYIHPLLFIDNSDEFYHELNPLKNSVQNYIFKNLSLGNADNVAFFFRDVNTSKWTGVNEDESYTPSSMLKVAILVAYLRMADQDPDVLQRKLYYKFEEDGTQLYKTDPLAEGGYTVLDLLQQMIVESDNTAMQILWQKNAEEISKVFNDLKLPISKDSTKDFMSAREYSRLFRILFNASYLSRFYSEKALQILTYTKFDKGLVQGVLPSTAVAHKFGELSLYAAGELKYRELHDCGIVYYPNRPYFICVMTKGKNFERLEKIIGDISKIVFEYQNKNID